MQMLISATQAGAESSPVGFGLDDHAGNQAAEPQGGAVASYVWFFRVPWLQILYPQLVASVTHPVVPQIPIPSYTYKAMICYDLIKPSGFNSWLLPLQFFLVIGCLSYFGPENTTRHHETHGRWYQGTPPLQERVLLGIPLPVPVIRQNRSECGHVLRFFLFSFGYRGIAGFPNARSSNMLKLSPVLFELQLENGSTPTLNWFSSQISQPI